MFLGLDGTLYDYFNGAEDLKRRRVAFVGDPVQRIQEDYLRILRYFRFYGRIAEESSSHDEKTLEAIRANVDGLKMISGERIWSEMRQILVGRYAGELFSLILETGCGPFVGIPQNYDPATISTIWSRLKDTEYNAVTLAVSALANTEEMMDFHERLKLSGFERDLGFFLVLNRNVEVDASRPPIRPYQFLVADAKREKLRDFVSWTIELMKYRGEPAQLVQELRDWQLPAFPVTGFTLTKNSVPKGKIMSQVLSELKEAWKESDFTMSVEQLESLIPGVVEKIQKRTPDKPAGGDSAAKKAKKSK
jgi:tRNA nucleotidyltransferase (CCA-adding enzyme)